MEYCDFSVVMSIIRKYVDEGRIMNQVDLLYQVFDSFLADNNARDFVFDNGLVCRWFNGQAKVSPRISGFYIDKKNQKELVKDIELNVIPLLYDSGMATQEIHDVLIQDTTISEKVKKKLGKNFPCETESDEAKFLAEVLRFSMERNFVRRDAGTKKLMAAGTFSPMIRDYILNGSLPKSCQHFCGCDRELVALHELLSKHGKVFLQGIPGIGKSELAKAYASHYKKAYTNVLYLVYSGDLKRDIVEMDLMCNLSMIPASGISGRLFAKWMKLLNLNTVNDLIEKGFVRVQEGHVIALHPMIQGMKLILKELTGMLGEQGIGTISDRALFLDYRATCEKNLNKAIKLEKEAVAMLAEITSDHALLASNLYANLGGLYKQNGNLEQAKQAIEEGIRILNEYGLASYHDSVAQITNYAVLLIDMGQAENGMAALQKLAEMVKKYRSDTCMDYACVQEALGGIHLVFGDAQKAVRCFQKTLKIYESIFEMEPEILEGKQRELVAMCERAGVYLVEKG